MITASFRVALAAAALAAALWLIPASIHIASWPASGPIRIAYLAPLARLWLLVALSGAGAAVLVLIARRRGASIDDVAASVSPLLLLWVWVIPYLPWLPDRAPLLLIFAGPLRWAAAMVAVLAIMTNWIGIRRLTPSFANPRAVVFVVSLAVYATLGVRYAREAGFGGDEPHYLIITQSLLADHDLDIANNHARRDYRAYFPGDLRPDFLQRGAGGEIYSIHAPGLPALLLPSFAIAGALGAVVFMAMLAALAAAAVFDTAAALTSTGIAAATWLAACVSIPFVPHAWLIYPEMAGAVIVAGAVHALFRRPSTSLTGLLWRGAALAVLPWLHTKFALLLACFAAFEVVRLWPRIKAIAVFLMPIVLASAAWLYSFKAMYGVIDPEAPYGSYTRMFVVAANIPRGSLGLLFDQKFGLLIYSPVYVVAIAGAWMMLRDRNRRWYAVALIATAVAFFASTTRLYMWWGGSSAPARFLVPIVPLLAPMLAVGLAGCRGTLSRAIVALTFAATAAVAVLTLATPGEDLLYSSPHGVSSLMTWLQGSAPLNAVLPTFTEENWRGPIRLLAPWLAALAIAFTVGAVLVRMQRTRSVLWTACSIAITFIATGSVLAATPATAERRAIVEQGQLALMRDYDPMRTHAVDATRLKRLAGDELMAAATLQLRRAPDEPIANARVLEGPFELPEGRYEARAWFENLFDSGAEAIVGVSDHITLARAPAASPAVLPFALPIRTPAFVGASDPAAARAVRRIDIAPVALVPRSRREPVTSHVVEPIGGTPAGFMAYADDHSYPEGGVFWTRDTQQGRVIIATAGARAVRLILHVGPQGGPVVVDAAAHRIDVDLQPDETRELEIALPPGAATLTVTVRATKSFRPSAVDPKSDDTRLLGCQVRPILVGS